jgi:hypothetical protein
VVRPRPCQRSRTGRRSCPFPLDRIEQSVEVVEICRVTAHAGHVPANQLDGLIELLLPPARDENVGTLDRSNPWPEAAGMSRSAFAACFKEQLEQTPLEYVTEWRMQKAMQLLQQRDKKLLDVARSVGYESDAAFSKAFKRVVGVNPGEYRKRGFKDPG